MERARPLLALLVPLCTAAAAFLLPHGAAAAFLLPHRAAGTDGGGGVCANVSCGMGTCSESSDNTLGFSCQCKPGWSRNHNADADQPQSADFLPCVVPNCTIHSSCQDGSPSSSSPSPAPAPPTGPPPPLTTSDPCLMQYCGDGGTCERVSRFTHRCICRDGYANLLNDTFYPCYQPCSLGSDCKNLGIDVINGSAPNSSPPVSVTVNKSGAGATAAAAPADTLLGLLLLLLAFYGLQ